MKSFRENPDGPENTKADRENRAYVKSLTKQYTDGGIMNLRRLVREVNSDPNGLKWLGMVFYSQRSQMRHQNAQVCLYVLGRVATTQWRNILGVVLLGVIRFMKRIGRYLLRKLLCKLLSRI